MLIFRYGDMRVQMGYEILSMWQNLGKYVTNVKFYLFCSFILFIAHIFYIGFYHFHFRWTQSALCTGNGEAFLGDDFGSWKWIAESHASNIHWYDGVWTEE